MAIDTDHTPSNQGPYAVKHTGLTFDSVHKTVGMDTTGVNQSSQVAEEKLPLAACWAIWVGLSLTGWVGLTMIWSLIT